MHSSSPPILPPRFFLFCLSFFNFNFISTFRVVTKGLPLHVTSFSYLQLLFPFPVEESPRSTMMVCACYWYGQIYAWMHWYFAILDFDTPSQFLFLWDGGVDDDNQELSRSQMTFASHLLCSFLVVVVILPSSQTCRGSPSSRTCTISPFSQMSHLAAVCVWLLQCFVGELRMCFKDLELWKLSAKRFRSSGRDAASPSLFFLATLARPSGGETTRP